MLMTNIVEKYRLKALASEGLARDATDRATREAWSEIAIEWHALANRAAEETAIGSKPSMKPNGSVAVS
jgi:hypothetical protein